MARYPIYVVALLVAVASPVLRDPDDDGYPLSTYPMFAHARGPTVTLAYAIGVTATGERRVLEPELVGTHEVLQALMVIDGAVASHEVAPLCQRIAAAVAADPDRADIAAIRIVRGSHDAVQLLVDDALGPELDYARCAVSR